MYSKGENIFTIFLDLLKVKYTNDFSNRYFNEHPHKYNLFGLSKMLSDYGVENAGTRIADKEKDLFNIECPFTAHTGNDFVVVHKIEPDKVHYLWKGKEINLSVSQFIQSWSGVILLTETTPDSGEPDYQEHRKNELFGIAQKSILILAAILILGISYANQLFSHSAIQLFGYSIILLLNIIGVYIGYLLVLKQMHIHSQYADKICTLFSKSDCNNVLESEAAKLWGIFGWSEIGLGYFSANILLLLFLPYTISLIAILNILTLPYSLWSVWYQKVKARQWCPLCLIVQVLLWAIFIVNYLFRYIQIPAFSYSAIQLFIFIVSVYAVSIFSFNLLIPALSKGNGMEQITQEINSMKANEEVFRTLLTQQPYYEVSRSDSQILFGNRDAQLKVSILTNPFCNPCARIHKRVEKILKDTKREISIQYIFSSFHPDLNFANKYLIAIYLEKEQQEFERIIADWFEKGKALRDDYFKDMNLDMENPEIEIEFQKHEEWRKKTQLRATPTVLVNGYQLPENYKVEDLRYFTDFNMRI